MKKRIYIISSVFILLFLSFTIFGERGLLRIYHLSQEKEDIQQRIVLVKAENDQLKREIEALKSDKRYIETIARKDFGLVRKNEVIYQFPAKR
jgi:cell division protein FtsB